MKRRSMLLAAPALALASAIPAKLSGAPRQPSMPSIWSKVERIRPESGGARGDGLSASDTASAINAAALYAAKTGKILHLTRGAEYAMAHQVILPAGLRVENDGAVFRPQYVPADGDEAIVLVGENVVANELCGHLDAKIGIIGHMFEFGSGARIGSIIATSDDLIQNGGVTTRRRSGAVLFINAGNVQVDYIEVTNFYNGWTLYRCNDVTVGRDRISGCWKGITWNIVDNCHLRGGHSEHLVSRNREKGALGFIGAGVKNSSIQDRVTIDTGEHGFRLGGDGLYGDLLKDKIPATEAQELATSVGFTLRDCKAIRPLGCAFKNQTQEFVVNRDIRVTGLRGEDVDDGRRGGTNSDFIRITNAVNVTLSDCVNRHINQTYSGNTGLLIQGCDQVYSRNLQLGVTASRGCNVHTNIPDAGGSRDITKMNLEFSASGMPNEGFYLQIGRNSDVIHQFTAQMEVFGAGTGMKLDARPDGTSPLTASSLIWLGGYVANCTINKEVEATYTGSRFNDNVSAPL